MGWKILGKREPSRLGELYRNSGAWGALGKKIWKTLLPVNWNGNTARNFPGSIFLGWEHLLGIFSARILDGGKFNPLIKLFSNRRKFGEIFKRKKLEMGRMELKKNQAATEIPSARFLCKNGCENHGKNNARKSYRLKILPPPSAKKKCSAREDYHTR